MVYTGFVGPAYASRSPNADSEKLINLYAELIDSGTPTSRTVFYRTPGRQAFATSSATGGRQLFVTGGRTFAVIGGGFYEILSTGVSSLIGHVPSGSAPAMFASNGTAGNQIGLVCGGQYYLYTLGGAFTQPSLPFTNPVAIGFLDGYFILIEGGSLRFWLSALNDGSSVDPLDFETRSQSSDVLITGVVNHRELWVLGSETTQVFYDSGDADNPLQPNPAAFIEQGIIAPDSLAVLDESLLWLSGTTRGAGVVVRTQGYRPSRVSSHALEFAMQSYSTLTDAIAYTYQEDGHGFYVLTFPTAGKTWALDTSTGLWHERGAFSNGQYSEDRVRCHVYAFGQHLVGCRDTGTIYTQSLSLLDDAGTPIRRLRRAPHLNAELQWNFYDQLQLDLQPGSGLVSGQGTDPSLMLRWSDDGGHTWSNEHTTSAGLLGAYGTRAIWRNLGRSRNRVFEVAMSDPVDLAWVAAYLRLTPGTAQS